MGKVNRAFRNSKAWLSKYHVALTVVLAMMHIGLSGIHVRDSGGGDHV